MARTTTTQRTRRVLTAPLLAALLGTVAAPALAVDPGTSGNQHVTRWIDRHARPLASTDPDAPLRELVSLRGVVGRAPVVGLGESTHGSREQFRLKHRMFRFLVERMGFRTLAFEEDFAGGVAIDRYVTTGQGDVRQVVADMSFPFWKAEEILQLVRWMRSYNETHDEQVRFLGTDVIALRQSSFDAVRRYVQRVAPARLEELRREVHPIRLRGSAYEQIQWYGGLSEPEQRAMIGHARRVSRLVETVARGDTLVGEYAEQHARAILGWYENFAKGTGFRSKREVFIADTVQWWRRVSGDKVAYWGANAHTSSAPTLTHRTPEGAQTGTMAGGYLEHRLGARYVSIGAVFHHGSISSEFTNPGPHRIGDPPADMLDATLGTAAPAAYLLDLRRAAPSRVRTWLRAPATMRMILPSYVEGEADADYNMSVPSLREAFDAVVFIRTTTASRLLRRSPGEARRAA